MTLSTVRDETNAAWMRVLREERTSVSDGTARSASFNPYAGSKANLSQPVAWKADLDRDSPQHPDLEGHAEDTARMVGKIFQELGDDLADMVERAFSDDVPEAARRNAKQPSPRGPADQVVDEIDISESLTRVITEQNLVAMEEGAQHHAERLEAEIEERLDEDTAQASIGFNVEDTAALDEMRESAAARMVTVNETIKEKIRRIIVDNFEDGGNVTTLTRALREQVDELSTSHARLVARTETLMASRQGSQALAESNDLVGGKEWIATRDQRTRPWHMAMHGEMVPVNDKFTVPSGWTGAPDYQPADYPRSAKVVGMDQPFNCFLPGTTVMGDVASALKTRYDGPARELVLASGHRLRVTPNHPILTPEGFRPAGDVDPGSDLVRHTGPVDSDSMGRAEHDEEHSPLPIEEVYETLSSAGRETRLLTSGDLHGDAVFGDGEVNVAGLPSLLQHSVDASVLQERLEPALAGTDMALLGFEGLGSRRELVKRGSLTATGSPGGGQLVLDSVAPGLLDPLPLTLLRLGLPADRYAHLPQRPAESGAADAGFVRKLVEALSTPVSVDEGVEVGDVDAGVAASDRDAALSEALGEGAAADGGVVGELVDALAGPVALDEVVEVRDFHFSGDVYDLQTRQGYYFAEGVVVSNCRCSQVPVLREDMPEDVTELAAHPDVTITGVPPLVDTAHGSRGKEVMREHALPAESFDEFVERIVDEADSVRSLAAEIGVGKATMYDWMNRAGVDA